MPRTQHFGVHPDPTRGGRFGLGSGRGQIECLIEHFQGQGKKITRRHGLFSLHDARGRHSKPT